MKGDREFNRKYKQTEFDRMFMKAVDDVKMKYGCLLSGRFTEQKNKNPELYVNEAFHFSYKLWKAYIFPNQAAIIVSTATGEQIDVSSFESDDALFQAIYKAKTAEYKQRNCWQYCIFDKTGKFITGDLIREDREIFDVIEYHAEEICGKLKEEYWKANPEEWKKDQAFYERLKNKNWDW